MSWPLTQSGAPIHEWTDSQPGKLIQRGSLAVSEITIAWFSRQSILMSWLLSWLTFRRASFKSLKPRPAARFKIPSASTYWMDALSYWTTRPSKSKMPSSTSERLDFVVSNPLNSSSMFEAKDLEFMEGRFI